MHATLLVSEPFSEQSSQTRWLVLTTFAFHTATNAFLFMSYSTTPDVTKSVLSPAAPLTGVMHH
jgi:hypothetical protein